MLLCSSSGEGVWFGEGWSGEVGVDLAGDVALEAADDLAFAEAFGGAAGDVVAGGLVVSHPDDGDDVEGAVGGAVAASAEAVAAGGSAAAGRLGCDAAELGEGCFVADAGGVVAGGDEELAGDLDADSVQFDEVGCGGLDDRFDLPVEGLDLLVEGLPAAGQVAQGGLDGGQEQSVGVVDQGEQVAGLGT
jgi:hypothetical protein